MSRNKRQNTVHYVAHNGRSIPPFTDSNNNESKQG